MAEDSDFRFDEAQIKDLLFRLSFAQRGTAIKRSLEQGALNITRWIKVNRLTGPRPGFLDVVSGRLRSSVSAGRAETRGDEWFVRIGTNVNYAEKHEFGIGVKARPFLKPGIEDKDNQDTVLNLLTENINLGLEGKL